MYSEILQIILTTLIPVSILVFLVWTGNWKILLAISILVVSYGFFTLNTFMTLDGAGLQFESSSASMLALAIVNFLRAIFILLLAIFTWLRKESISIEHK